MGCGRKIGPYECCSVIHGDSTELIRDLPDGCVDAVITDPPYPEYKNLNNCYDLPMVLSIPARLRLIYWPANMKPPLANPVAEHIWDKPNNCAGHWYEKIYAYGESTRVCKVYRACVIFPNYDQFAAECVNHPFQKPLKLMCALLEDYRTGTILDPFCGSGTTLVAAKKLGRHFLGFEISPEYCEIARDRLARIDAQPTLFEPKPEQLELGGQ